MRASSHPQAKFDPIPPDLDLHDLVDRTPNFEWVVRISAAQIRNLGPQEFERLIVLHVITGGRPLVIEKWNERLPRSLFSSRWLEASYNKKEENVWDIGAQTNIPMTTGHYLRSMKQLSDQWTANNFRDDRRQRLYLKDIDCPLEWQDHLQKVLPRSLFYLNENVQDRGNAQDDDMFVDSRSAAPAGDLMSSLPDPMRAQNLMCYVGHEGTYTPAHREMCASLGQNIMVEASADENGEKKGSSIWFMTETKDREVVKEYFLSMLGHDVEIEKHFAQINAWKKASFPVYVVEQKVGDFILVPPLAPHQVWNRGTRTMKVAWNRTTVETLEMALHEALPKARLVCRDEQYKNKAIIYFTLEKYSKDLRSMEESADLAFLGIGQELMRDSFRLNQVAQDFKRLLELYTEILVDEMFSSKEKNVEFLEFDSNVTCSYCRANIFNRFLTCKHCVRFLVNGDEDTYDICMECYAMGRSCVCVSGLNWCEQWSWSELVDNYETWRNMVIKNDGYVDLELSPLPLEIARKKTGKRSVAQICQEALRRRPFKDITKPEEKSDLELPEPEVDAEGRIKKIRPSRRKKKGDVYKCHVCGHKDHTYRLAFCSTPGCNQAYCFGVLYRGFDMMPQTILQQEKWTCPRCLGICNCARCRRLEMIEPYTPKNTLLGHDTRRIADDRSVESLVDFRLHNLAWLKKVGEEGRSNDSKRMQRLREAADAAKAKDGVAGEAANLDAAMQQSIVSGLDEQEQISGAHDVDEDTAVLDPLRQALDQPDAPLAVVDMEASEKMDESSYPDPTEYPDASVYGQSRMLGLGYYQQDDSSDKILFDPYQQTPAENVAGEEEVSEFLKKSLRAAKRRARLQNDNDPDFNAPKSHHRKKPRLEREDIQDQVSNLDPALLADDSSMADAPPPDDTPSPAADDPSVVDEEIPHGGLRYEANRPELRHVKPKTSYAEVENEWEFNEVLPVKEPVADSTQPATEERGSQDPLDLAAEAIRSLHAPQATPSSRTPASAPRKRGRARKSDTLPSRLLSRKWDPPAAPLSKPTRERGRPPRNSLRSSTGQTDAAVEQDASDAEDEDGIIAGLAAQLEAELAEEDNNTTAEAGPPTTQSQPQTAKKRRGRPPKAKVAAGPTRAEASESPTLPPPVDTRFLTMAQRMALRGKKFKLGQRRSGGAARPMDKSQPSPLAAVASMDIMQSTSSTPVNDTSTGDQPTKKPEMEALDPETTTPSSSSQAGSPEPKRVRAGATPARKPTAPTVVRLSDSESEEQDISSSSDSEGSSFGDDDDDDIPATAPAKALRGRGRPPSLRMSGRGGRGGLRGRGGRAIRGRRS